VTSVRARREHVFVSGSWNTERDDAVRRRYDSGESAKSIARSLRADKRTVRTSLLRTGSIRTSAEARAVASVLARREDAVAAARGQGASLQAIATEFGVSTGAVEHALRRAGFALDPAEIVRQRARGRSVGASYFQSICDESRAYWLGFIAADGWLTQGKRELRFGLQVAGRDRAHLALLADHLGLRVWELPRGHVVIRSGNAALVHDLRRAGIIERKSSDPAIVAALEDCPEGLRRHFVRGLFDGDGSAFETGNGRRVVEFSGHRKMLEAVRTLAAEELGVAWNGLVRGGNDHFATVRWRHPLDVVKLSVWLYAGATVWLDRKRRVLEQPIALQRASLYRGVARSRRGTWAARISVGGRGGQVVSCGVFDDEISAARAYDRKACDLRGPRAALNLPDSQFCDPSVFAARLEAYAGI
jgi:DNA-binding CsgD family transcriptional regulator